MTLKNIKKIRDEMEKNCPMLEDELFDLQLNVAPTRMPSSSNVSPSLRLKFTVEKEPRGTSGGLEASLFG